MESRLMSSTNGAEDVKESMLSGSGELPSK